MPLWLAPSRVVVIVHQAGLVELGLSLDFLCGVNGDRSTVWPSLRHPPTQMSLSRDPSIYRDTSSKPGGRARFQSSARRERHQVKGHFFLISITMVDGTARGSGGIISSGMISSDMALPFHAFLPDSDAHLDYVPVRFISQGRERINR